MFSKRELQKIGLGKPLTKNERVIAALKDMVIWICRPGNRNDAVVIPIFDRLSINRLKLALKTSILQDN